MRSCSTNSTSRGCVEHGCQSTESQHRQNAPQVGIQQVPGGVQQTKLQIKIQSSAKTFPNQGIYQNKKHQQPIQNGQHLGDAIPLLRHSEPADDGPDDQGFRGKPGIVTGQCQSGQQE